MHSIECPAFSFLRGGFHCPPTRLPATDCSIFTQIFKSFRRAVFYEPLNCAKCVGVGLITRCDGRKNAVASALLPSSSRRRCKRPHVLCVNKLAEAATYLQLSSYRTPTLFAIYYFQRCGRSTTIGVDFAGGCRRSPHRQKSVGRR